MKGRLRVEGAIVFCQGEDESREHAHACPTLAAAVVQLIQRVGALQKTVEQLEARLNGRVS